MLLNFCDPRLRPEIKCSAISTDGHEVTNLINGSYKGYLAYSCIKPPIHIDITFLCNVCINHVLIWPSVGSQKSSGFQLSLKNTNDDNTPYTCVSNGCLSSHDAGLLFYSSDIDPTGIPTPPNFLRCCIKVSKGSVTTKYVHVLRITIYKTENSVPALGKVQVWGTVSPRCGKDITASVHVLWAEQRVSSTLPVTASKAYVNTVSVDTKEKDNRLKNNTTIDIPESFLDPITWEIMTQPIILPCGQIIDLTTLEKHEENEATWGRSLSDPFTGLGFNDERRPVMASALKSRIDKFLMDNSNQNEIKNMPRVLGRDPTSAIAGNRRIIEIPKCVLNRNLKRTAEDIKSNTYKQTTSNNSQSTKKYYHKLPIAVMPKRPAITIMKPRQLTNVSTFSKLTHNNSQNHKDDELVDDNFLDSNLKTQLSNMKRFTTPEKVELHKICNKCECCINSIFYRLPCKHVVCRQILLSIKNNRCKSCGFSYKSCEIERIYDNILNE
ncbi:PREDICTED: RING finger protein 37 [Cyphomyrmex costatus]|uniref:RING finger protein 37 n=1 Tax=Cyphomyrmex costatus TaxID=456900 RepID=A0A151IDC6_9HYME|nr:PREDICTED: RING finger protein 37 [Cyphomyrmex costatus]XP_018400036.1 PREDICTED: RING finger protein 37 [Cyphomyrmex costatus]KYM98380.1 RING finger protein 37 [Cyphomyrmex costatus]